MTAELGVLPTSALKDSLDIDFSDFLYFADKMKINYGQYFKNIDFSNENCREFTLIKDVYDECVKLGFSKQEFRKRVDEYLNENQYGIGNLRFNFLNLSNRKVMRDKAWLSRELRANASAAENIVGYELTLKDGTKIDAYMYADEFVVEENYPIIFPTDPIALARIYGKLSRKYTQPPVKVIVQEKYIAPQSPEEKEFLALTMENGKLQIEIAGQRGEIKRLTEELHEQKKEIKEMKKKAGKGKL